MIEIKSERLIMKTELNEEKINNNMSEDNVSESSILGLTKHKIENCGFGFYLKSEPKNLVCHIGLRMDRKPYEISYGTVEKYRKNGYMREAIECMIKWLFLNSNINKIYALICNNQTSEKIIKEKGFALEEENDNEKWYSLTKNDFNRLM